MKTHHTKAYTELLKAACRVESHSHIDLEANEYHVDVHAMASLCGAIAKASRQILSAHNRRLTKIQNAEAVVYRSAPPGLPAKEWRFPLQLTDTPPESKRQILRCVPPFDAQAEHEADLRYESRVDYESWQDADREARLDAICEREDQILNEGAED